MDVVALYRKGLDSFEQLVDHVGPGDWSRPTPCTAWSVRDLVNHIVYEDRWMVPLIEGQTIEEVGDLFDGDLLGDDPQAALAHAADAARQALAIEGVPARKVNLSYGEEHASEYLGQMAVDHHIHGWDLAKALGRTDLLDAEVVAQVAEIMTEDREGQFRQYGVIAPRLRADPDDAKATLLARLGRAANWTPTLGVVHRFQDALTNGDLDAAAALLAPDAVFESTSPPDGGRFEGRDEIRGFFEDMMAATTEPHFEYEEMTAAGDTVVIRSKYSWGNDDDTRGHVRGMELVRVKDGLVTEMLAYVKG